MARLSRDEEIIIEMMMTLVRCTAFAVAVIAICRAVVDVARA